MWFTRKGRVSGGKAEATGDDVIKTLSNVAHREDREVAKLAERQVSEHTAKPTGRPRADEEHWPSPRPHNHSWTGEARVRSRGGRRKTPGRWDQNTGLVAAVREKSVPVGRTTLGIEEGLRRPKTRDRCRKYSFHLHAQARPRGCVDRMKEGYTAC